MTFRAPSRNQMVLLFLIVGPMLWPYALLLAGPHSTGAMNGIYGTSLLNYISLIFIGFGAWLAFRPPKVSDMASLSQLVWMVAIIGAFLGVVAGAWPRLTPPIADAASPLN